MRDKIKKNIIELLDNDDSLQVGDKITFTKVPEYTSGTVSNSVGTIKNFYFYGTKV